jgi:HEAT repeat protein
VAPLLGHENPVVRLWALLLLEAQLAHLAPASVKEALATVEPGDEPAQRSVLARIRESLARTPDPAEADRMEATLLAGGAMPPAFVATLPSGVDPATLPEAARELLLPLVDCLVDHLRRGVLAEPARAWRALADLRHPGVMGAARRSFQRGKESPEMYRCLAAIRGAEVEDLLVKAAATATERMRPFLIELLGSVRDRDPMLLLGQSASSGRRADRIAAAYALGRSRRKGVLTLLSRLACDPDPDVACTALDSIALVRDRSVVPTLVSGVGKMTDASTRARLAAVLSVLGGEDARQLLAGLLADRAPEVSAAAAQGLAAYPAWSRDLIPQLSGMLADADPAKRAGAVLALFPHDAERAQQTLGAMLSASDPVARSEGASCVRFIQSQATVRALVAAMLRETDLEILAGQASVVSALAPATPIGLVQPLIPHAMAVVRSAASAFLTHHPEPQASQVLARMGATEAQPLVRRRVAQALVRRCRRENPDRLKDFLLDRDPRVIATAVESMEDLAGLEVVPFVGPLLGHTSNRVRANAIVTLFRMGRFDGLDHLLVMLEDPRGPAFASGLFAVARIGRAFAFDALRRSPALVPGLAEWYRKQTGTESGRLTLNLSTVRGGNPVPAYPVGAQSPTLGSASLDITVIHPPRHVPQSPEAQLEALLKQVSRADPAAVTLLKEHLTRFPGDLAARFLLLRALQRMGEDTEDLVDGYARETVGPFVNPYIELARVTKESGDGNRAMEFYIRSFESSVRALLRLVETARERLSAQDVLGTSRTLEVLGTLFPINPVLHATLGEHYLAVGDNERAFQELYRAHLAAPDHPVVALKLAAGCIKTARPDLAVRVLNYLIDSEDEASPFRAKAQQVLESLQSRARKREQERRQQAEEGRRGTVDPARAAGGGRDDPSRPAGG